MCTRAESVHENHRSPASLLLDPGRLLGQHIDVVTEAGLTALLQDQVLNGAVAL